MMCLLERDLAAQALDTVAEELITISAKRPCCSIYGLTTSLYHIPLSLHSQRTIHPLHTVQSKAPYHQNMLIVLVFLNV